MRPKTKDQRPKTKRQTEEAKAKRSKEPKELAIAIFNSEGKEVGKFELDKKIFTGEVNKKVLYQTLLMYNANQRRGTASTKTRAEVSGGGKKPWRQKGTGRARAGSIRSPLWRGGGVVFGPHPRNFHYELPKKVKKLSLLSSLNSKLIEDKILGIDSIDINEPKTKKFRQILKALKLEGRSLFVSDGIDENVERASKNLKELSVKDYKNFNTVDVLTCDNLVISKAALEKLPERFKDLI